MISGRAFGAVALCASPHSASKEHDLKHASSVMSLQFKTKRLDRLDAYEQENKEERTGYNKEKQRKNQHFAKRFLEMTNMEKKIAKSCQYRMKT